jgi:hypothetical protein
MTNAPTPVISDNTDGPTEQAERSYAEYMAEKELAFDPLKDLNLPGSYKEVLDRFDKLQVDRSPGSLN